ncbi:MAG: hypothetical protein INQ03_12490 [Candidatus Heimdallarchaeota archaeon]|nr:hypothetical protein [Candidatus Heimdallarchaeota archaeon]
MSEVDTSLFNFEIESKEFTGSRVKKIGLRVILGIALWFCISLTTQNQYVDDWYIIFPYLLPAMLIAFPELIRILKFIPIFGLRLSSKKISFLSKLPLIQFSGEWFIERDSESIKFNNFKSILFFLLEHWFSIFILPFATFLFMLRAIGSYESDVEVGILDIDTFREGADDMVYYYTVFGTTIILLIYVSLVWVWKDAELKIVEYRESSKGDTLEANELWYPSNIIKNFFALFVGFDIISRYLTGGAGIEDIYDVGWLIWDFVVGVLFDYFILEGGFIFIAMLLIYYTSGTHTYLVNSVRSSIKKQVENNKGNILIKSSSF